MEITRQLKPLVTAQAEGTVPTRKVQSASAQPTSPAAAEALPLEQLQGLLGELPEIDMAKVEAIKQALQRGEIGLDMAALSRSMVAYHNGSDT